MFATDFECDIKKHHWQTLFKKQSDICVQAPSDLEGAVTFLLEKVTQCPNALVLKLGYKRTQIAVKTSTFTILTPNETVIIPKIESCCPNHGCFACKNSLISETGGLQLPRSALSLGPYPLCIWLEVSTTDRRDKTSLFSYIRNLFKQTVAQLKTQMVCCFFLTLHLPEKEAISAIVIDCQKHSLLRNSTVTLKTT